VRGEIVLMIDRAASETEVTAGDSAQSVATLVAAFETDGLDHRAALKKVARGAGDSTRRSLPATGGGTEKVKRKRKK